MTTNYHCYPMAADSKIYCTY